MNFKKNENSKNKNRKQEDNNINPENINNNKKRALNFIFNSSNKLFKKEYPENENNSDINLASYKKEIIFKLTSFSQERQQVVFSNGVEEIFDDSKIADDKLFYNISNKKFSTPPRNSKSSYKKTKEHIKTPYKTTKSRSSRNKSKNNKENNKSNISTKSSNYWKSLLFDEEMINNNISQDMNIDINRICNSVILENPFGNKKEYRTLFSNNYNDDNEEDLNKSF